MKELVQYAFDFFGYVIPGLFVIFSICIIAIPLDSFEQVIELTSNFEIGMTTVLIVVAYVIGFCIYPIGRMLYKTLGFKLFGNRIVNNSKKSGLSVPAKYALLRHYSPINFKYVESWNIYCAMSHNLMVACLVYSLVAIIRAFEGINVVFWIGTAVFSLLLFLILTHRAVTYFHWAADDINATISSLNLEGSPVKDTKM